MRLALLSLLGCGEPEIVYAPKAPLDEDSGPAHPDGYGLPEAHGPDAKLQASACADCHGADLTGGESGVSCDLCHEEGWRTDCTRCHGGTENTTGAPPRDIDGETDPVAISFPPHSIHVTDTDLKLGFTCTACHVTPSDVLSAGHVFVGDATPAVAEVDFTGGSSPAARWDGQATCSDSWCHGPGPAGGGTAMVGQTFDSCASCHPFRDSGSAGWSTMSGQHDRHLSEGEGFECGDCHKSVVYRWDPIEDPSLHVDGAVSVTPVGTIVWDPATKSCTGECHEEHHEGNAWVQQGP